MSNPAPENPSEPPLPRVLHDAGSPATERAPLRRVESLGPTPAGLPWTQKFVWSISVGDAVLIAVAITVAQLTRFGLDGGGAVIPDTEIAQTSLGVALGLAWWVALAAVRSREARIIGVGLTEYQRVANATLVTVGALAVFAFFLKLDVARGYLAIALPLGLVLLLLGRLAWRKVLLQLRRSDKCLSSAIVVGPRRDVTNLLGQLNGNLWAGYRAIAVVITDGAPSTESVDGLPRISLDRLVRVSRVSQNRAVIIAGELPGGAEQIRDLSWALEDSRAELILMSRLTDVAGPRIHLRPVTGLPMMHVDLPQYTGLNHSAKRAFDILASSLALILLLPVFAVIAVAVRAGSPGPALFRQERVGVRGRRFTMLKFRSMTDDAERALVELVDRDEGHGPLFKLQDDPRVTPLGKFLRRHSLDELPQFWNVLIGDMSLVGPRPPLPCEVAQYEDRVNRRLLTKPGVTGLWQISGRSRLSWEESVKLDLFYVENWSFTSDLLILLRTVRAVIKHDGAY